MTTFNAENAVIKFTTINSGPGYSHEAYCYTIYYYNYNINTNLKSNQIVFSWEIN